MFSFKALRDLSLVRFCTLDEAIQYLTRDSVLTPMVETPDTTAGSQHILLVYIGNRIISRSKLKGATGLQDNNMRVIHYNAIKNGKASIPVCAFAIIDLNSEEEFEKLQANTSYSEIGQVLEVTERYERNHTKNNDDRFLNLAKRLIQYSNEAGKESSPQDSLKAHPKNRVAIISRGRAKKKPQINTAPHFIETTTSPTTESKTDENSKSATDSVKKLITPILGNKKAKIETLESLLDTVKTLPLANLPKESIEDAIHDRSFSAFCLLIFDLLTILDQQFTRFKSDKNEIEALERKKEIYTTLFCITFFLLIQAVSTLIFLKKALPPESELEDYLSAMIPGNLSFPMLIITFTSLIFLHLDLNQCSQENMTKDEVSAYIKNADNSLGIIDNIKKAITQKTYAFGYQIYIGGKNQLTFYNTQEKKYTVLNIDTLKKIVNNTK